MTQDPADPESFDEFLDDEQAEERYEEGLDEEAPEADAAEQRFDLLRLRDTPLAERTADEADPADAAEQARVVDPGDDEYR
ncbi:hypothetical protein [Streptomyces sp. PT12]|uniref:hypothetical protein n=1 Tax=Streptomyces sp. PT12 TaxID=1510197 RepID=UPI000DE263CB|nr:hypothetical protein [Streptomyces sp. PT12]RBM11876.1 hypothetical protein DEH69_21615 [Streptomyces sp. PT12]